MSELIGKTIGQYQLIEDIKETGKTLVYKGFQPSVNRYVAVKILKPGIARQPEEMQRFRQQGDLLAQLQHPRLLEVYETGEAEGMIFRATRLAENGSLQDRLIFGPQNPFYETNQAINLFREIVEGLEFIHSRGYIHGNLKPGNILLDAMMHPLLSDFGLPGKLGDVSSPYIAPEQVQGGVVDRRSDVYALGALLYATLVGVEPPAGVAASPRSSRPDLPADVEMVIFKAMAQNPGQRFQSANEFFYAMQTAFTTPLPVSQPVYAPMPTVSQSVIVESQKKGTSWVGIIVGVLIVLALCFGAVFVYRTYSQNQAVVPTEPGLPGEPRPTRPPIERPTNLPDDQPAQLPEGDSQPPQQEQPGSGLPICNSIGLVGVPLVLIGARRVRKKRE